MAQYLISITHTPDECLDTYERMQRESPTLLAHTVWGCLDGEHYGWALVEAESEREARDMLPRNLRDNARIAEVRRITPEALERLRHAAA